MPITVPTVGSPTYQSWAKAVADKLNTGEKRFALWRTTNQTLAVDGFSQVIFEQKDDPAAMIQGTSQFKAPVAGVVILAASCRVDFGATTQPYSFVSLFLNATEIRRGSMQTFTSAGGAATFASSLSAIVPVAINDVIELRAFAQAPGATKTLGGTRQTCYLEGIYT